MAKKLKRKQVFSGGKPQVHMKLVTSDVCAVCRQQCARGIRYMERLERPGAVGNGVPCVLTSYTK